MPQPDPTCDPLPAAGPQALAQDSSQTTSIVRTTCEGLDPAGLVADLAGRDPEGSSRFEIRRLLGSGSFGKVTLAFDRVLHREVAIKQPRERLAPRARDVFVHEARLAARIRHPGIVVVHDVAVDKSEIPYVVYEYVEGGSLREKLTGEAWPLPAALTLALALAEGLAAAHKEGLTHRDLKPANVLLDRTGQPRIADFGLAVEAERQHALKGEVAGTQKYMAPEQCCGDAHLVDGRTDLWALGVILYELLTGRHPFWSPESDADDLTDQILTRDPRPLRQWNDAVPPRVEQLCLTLLAKPIADRPSSAADVADELRLCLETLDAEHAPAPAPPADARGLRAGAIYATLAAIACLLIGIAVVRWLGGGGDDSKTGGSPPGGATSTPSAVDLGVWQPLLREEPRAIRISSSAKVEFAPGSLSIKSDYPALLQLGQTQARDYSLRTTIHWSEWSGDVGLFLGFGPASDPTQDQCFVVALSKRKSGQIHVQPSWMTLQRTGLQLPDVFVHLPHSEPGFPLADSGQALLQIDVEDGRLRAVFLDDASLKFPPQAEGARPIRPGRFGIYFLRGSARFSGVEFRVTQLE